MSRLVDHLGNALHSLDALPGGAGANAQQLQQWFGIERFREAAVLIPLVRRASGWQVLLTLRNDGLRNHGGQVAFPGGSCDADDCDLVVTALRETREELGIPARDIQPIGALDPLATVSGFRVTPIVARLDSGYVAYPDASEVADAFEVPLAALCDVRNQGYAEMRMGGATRKILEYRLSTEVSPHRIWGATAMMLDDLRRRLETLQ